MDTIISIRELMSSLSISVDVEAIRDEDLLESHGIDSIALMELMVILEEHFKIEFDENKILEIFKSISSISVFINDEMKKTHI